MEKLTQEELKLVSEANDKRNKATANAEKTVLEAKNAQLEYQVLVQHVFIKYGLSFGDKIDDATGVITRSKQEVKDEQVK